MTNLKNLGKIFQDAQTVTLLLQALRYAVQEIMARSYAVKAGSSALIPQT